MIQNFHTIICLLQHHFQKCLLQKKYLVFTGSAGRWGLVFKRYKSILGLGSIPTKTKESTEAWLDGKMLLALLAEKFLGNVGFFPPPPGKQEKNRSIWRETRLVFLLILMVIMPQDNLPFGQDFLHFSVSSFVEKRKKDRLQMASFSLS